MRIEEVDVGDYVVGNEKATKYAITIPGWVGEVMGFYSTPEHDNLIKVRGKIGESGKIGEWPVDPSCFDVYETSVSYSPSPSEFLGFMGFD